MNFEKIKDVAEAFFTFILYTLAIICCLIGGISFLFTLAFFIGMIGGYPHAFTGFCISFGTMIVSMIIFGLLNVELDCEWAI